MNKPNIIMMNQEVLKKIGEVLRQKNEDVYLLFELITRTGCTASSISKMRVGEMKCFIKQYIHYLPTELLELLEEHFENLEEEDYFFSGQRANDHSTPLSRRSYESLILCVGNKMGIENLTVKTLSRSFFYGYLRDHNYDFKKLKAHMRMRKRYVLDIHSFLFYCGISEEEYEDDRLKHIKPDIKELQARIDNIIELLTCKKERFASGIYVYEDVVDALRIVENI